ncbi:hypothetical protein OIU74_012289 [Salix koriyanagi]|uniref:Uncharacterized protein n=1 Tax=Salix koriyanagi TaxID=2511006 RepID=A0A9Q0Q6P5_9ROSI|nr:hypothetical protein OIU74_012289 [Salix koriyanagi]
MMEGNHGRSSMEEVQSSYQSPKKTEQTIQMMEGNHEISTIQTLTISYHLQIMILPTAIHTNELEMPNSDGGDDKNSEAEACLFMEIQEKTSTTHQFLTDSTRTQGILCTAAVRTIKFIN